MSIANKLSYLNQTKKLIRESINNIGGNLTLSNTFRSYAAELQNIYNRLPKVTNEGTNFVLSPTLGNDKLNILGKGNLAQQTYEGKNFLDISSANEYVQEVNYPDYTLDYKSDNLDITVNSLPQGSSQFGLFYAFQTVIGQTYYVTSIFDTNIIANVRIYDTNQSTNQLAQLSSGTETSFTATTEITYFRIWVRSRIGTSNISYSMISKTSNVDYEPYVGGQASPNPSYPQPIKVVTGDNKVIVRTDNLTNINLNETSENMVYIDRIIQVKKGHTYYVALAGDNIFGNIKGTNMYFRYQDANNDNLYGWKNGVDFDKGKYIVAEYDTYIGIRVAGFSNYTNLVISENIITEYVPYKRQELPLNLSSKNLFIPSLTNRGTNISPSNCTVSINNDEFTMIKTGQDARFGEIQSSGSIYYKNLGQLFDVSDVSNIKVFITNALMNKNFFGLYDENLTSLGYSAQFSTNEFVYTIPNNVKYILLRIGNQSEEIGTELKFKVMVTKDTTATEYEEYYNYEPCKIGDYQDEFILENGTWYIDKKIRKVILDGTENWQRQLSVTTGKYSFYISHSVKNTNISNNGFCDYFNFINSGESIVNFINAIRFNSSHIFIILDGSDTSVESFKTWLASHNVTVYYELATPVREEITNTTLISQLNAIYNAISYSDKTYIETESDEENAQLIVSADCLRGEG